MSGWPRRSGWHAGPPRRARDRPRGRRCGCRPGCRVREGRRPPPRPVALDREAPPCERAVQGGGGDDDAVGWILAPRLPEPEGQGKTDEWRSALTLLVLVDGPAPGQTRQLADSARAADRPGAVSVLPGAKRRRARGSGSRRCRRSRCGTRRCRRGSGRPWPGSPSGGGPGCPTGRRPRCPRRRGPCRSMRPRRTGARSRRRSGPSPRRSSGRPRGRSPPACRSCRGRRTSWRARPARRTARRPARGTAT